MTTGKVNYNCLLKTISPSTKVTFKTRFENIHLPPMFYEGYLVCISYSFYLKEKKENYIC